MRTALKRTFSWHAGPPSRGPALIAAFGCALPLLLGLLSAHPGFLWASAGAFQAAQANPLHRLGMLRMLALCGLGALSAALGCWSASNPLIAFWLFAASCLCLGQGQYGLGNFNNPSAIAMLFVLGGLWVMLLAFGLRGLHGLRMWPYMPRFISIFKVLRRHARRLPRQQWRLHALGCTLAMALAGLTVSLAGLERGYWLTLTLAATLHLEFQGNLVRALQASLSSLAVAGLLILLGYSVHSPATMVTILLVLITLCRALQANHYGLFMAQTTVCFLLLAESFAQDWQLVEPRLLNALFGVVLALFVALLIHGLRQLLQRHAGQVAADPK